MQPLAAVFFIISGILVATMAISLLLKWTGMGQTLQSMLQLFGSFFNSVFQLLHSILISAPGFMKIIFFLVLFSVFGTFVLTYTVGMTHACAVEIGRAHV